MRPGLPCPAPAELPPPSPGRGGWPWTAASPAFAKTMPDGRAWPRISIVTPSYNQARFLEATIRSVLLQGYPNLEYIVVDGGSEDGSVGIIERYERCLAAWVSEKDGGHANGLNKGFSLATGEIMAWINSDDIYWPGAFQTVAEVFGHFADIEWLTSALPTSFDETPKIARLHTPGFSPKFFAIGGYIGLPYSTGWIQQESTFWKRSLWTRAGGTLDESLSMAIDLELWNRFFRLTSLATVDAMLGNFRVHEGQRSHHNWSLYRREATRCLGLEQQSLRLPVPAVVWRRLGFERQGVPLRVLGLSAAGYLYRRSVLGKLVHWRHVAKLMYGERVPVVTRGGHGSWKKDMKWIA